MLREMSGDARGVAVGHGALFSRAMRHLFPSLPLRPPLLCSHLPRSASSSSSSELRPLRRVAAAVLLLRVMVVVVARHHARADEDDDKE